MRGPSNGAIRALVRLVAMVGAGACSGPPGSPGTMASSCVRSPSISGDLAPAWAYGLGEGTAGSAKLDAQGNLVVVGAVFDTLTVGGQTFPNPGSSTNHAFAMALDPNGNVVWQRMFSDNWQPMDFALDAAGNIYVVGTQGYFVPAPADLGLGPIAGPVILAKLDGTGNTIWGHGLTDVIDSSVTQVIGLSLAVDPSGQVAVAGQKTGGGSFIAGYDAAGGSFLWNLVPQGSTSVPVDLAFDSAGNLIVAGNFAGTLDWGPPLTVASSAFVMALDAHQNVLSSVALGDDTVASALAVDGTKTYVAGTFSGSLTLGGTTWTSQGLADLFIAQLDDGAQLATSPVAHFPAGKDRFDALFPDGAGGLWALGEIADFVDFGAGLAGPTAAVALHLGAAGQIIASGVFPKSSGESLAGRAVVADASGNLWLYGTFSGAIDFGGAVLTEPAAGALQTDLYLARYSAGQPAVVPQTCPPGAGALLDSNGPITPTAMAFAGAGLAVTTGTETVVVPPAGAAPAVRAVAQRNTVAIAVHDQTIYWGNAGTPSWQVGPSSVGSIVSMPVSGGTPTTLAGGLDAPVAIATDGTNVYWTTEGPQPSGGPLAAVGSLMTVPVGGGTPTTLASGFAYVGPVAAANGVVVFAAGATYPTVGNAGSTQILKISPAGGDAVQIAGTDRTISSIALDATTVYWTESNSPTVDVSTNDGRIASVGLAGSGRAVLLSNQPAPYGLSLQGGRLAWCNAGGSANAQSQNSAGVWSMPATGGSPTAIVSGLAGLGACAGDATHLAWVAYDGGGSWKLIVR